MWTGDLACHSVCSTEGHNGGVLFPCASSILPLCTTGGLLLGFLFLKPYLSLGRAPPSYHIGWECHRKALEQRDVTPKTVSEGEDSSGEVQLISPQYVQVVAQETPERGHCGNNFLSLGTQVRMPSSPYAFRKPNMLIWAHVIQATAHFLCMFTYAGTYM